MWLGEISHHNGSGGGGRHSGLGCAYGHLSLGILNGCFDLQCHAYVCVHVCTCPIATHTLHQSGRFGHCLLTEQLSSPCVDAGCFDAGCFGAIGVSMGGAKFEMQPVSMGRRWGG